MSDFERLRDEYRAAQAVVRDAERATKREAERLKRLQRAQQAFARRDDQNNTERERERAELARELEGARSALDKARATVDALRAREAELTRAFAQLADPREAIAGWDDATPILLLPLRLETRFKSSPSPDGGPLHELWVRVFPDDCWIDGFDPMLTLSELQSAKRYYTAVSQAGGDEALERSAWHTLVESHGAGRAAWILRQYQPTHVEGHLEFPPDPETAQSAWASAPKFQLLPERFVFIGYSGAAAPRIELGGAIPARLFAGPDPSAPKEQQLRHDEQGNLVVPDELRWLTDFERALEVGMGFRIRLTPEQASRGFDRVFVVGVRLASDAKAGKTELTTLLEHHAYSRTGLSLVPQGTPTNNTEATDSGHGRAEDSDESFDAQQAPLYSVTSSWTDKRDGQWLAEFLGLEPAFFDRTRHADGTDQLGARAMHRALYPGTLGYWMQTMMAPGISAQTQESIRRFFCDYVLASGAIPALRIGAQPYGVLSATPWSRLEWFERNQTPGIAAPASDSSFLRALYRLILEAERDLRTQLSDVSYVGKSGDAQALLLDIIGLHPGSVEWSQRYAESLETLYNRLALQGFSGVLTAIVTALRQDAARNLLTRLGYAPDLTPKQLSLVFSGAHQALKGGVVDDRPLSEVDPIRAYTPSGQNYLAWLADAAGTSLDALYQQNGFVADKPPTALLYLVLRYALQHGYHDTSLRLLADAGILSELELSKARSDDPFLHVRTATQISESRYQPLYSTAPSVTGSATQTVGDFIGARVRVLPLARDLSEQIAAIEQLAPQPTAQLERLFADHVDSCAYRLDAWRLGLQTVQLCQMRNLRSGSDSPARDGVYLGAWGVLEELRPENKRLTPVRLSDPALIEDFGKEPAFRDSSNQGYIHAPSLNHAVTAAVLRNGYLSNADPETSRALAVNLSSERVRTALGLLEGVRAGQSLSDLLGYQLERGLHDRHGMAEVDKFIYKLRKAFPLRADRLKSTRTAEGVPIEAIEARNVVDGLALVEHVQKTGNASYPFGKDLPPATTTEAAAIDAEVQRLLDAHDAVADLALSEGVYQAVLGNYDRVASTYDAYARGHFPPEPDVVRTPLNGTALTHRVAVHLPTGIDPTSSAWSGIANSPRGCAEPALNHWLAGVLPRPEQVGCVVTFREAATGATLTRELTLDELGLQPVDWLYLLHDSDEPAMSELDDRIVRAARARFAMRPDVSPTIGYVTKLNAPYSVFELMPLTRQLRMLATRSRPLRASDLALMNEASPSLDNEPHLDPQRLQLPLADLQTLRNDVSTFTASLRLELDDLATHRDALLAAFDSRITTLADLLGRASRFAIPQAGWGFAYDLQRRAFDALLTRAGALVSRWDLKLANFDERITDFDTLPATASAAARFRFLVLAEREIATTPTDPLPATPDLFRNDLVNVRRVAFVNRRDQIQALRTTTATRVFDLLSAFSALLPLTAFDAEPFTLEPNEAEIIRACEDLARVLAAVLAEIERRLAAATATLADHAAAGSELERTRALEACASALFGEGFKLFPEFSLDATLGAEVENVVAASRSGELFQTLVTPTDPSVLAQDFPIDTWMYGVARVREKMAAWEQLVQLSGALGATEPELLACQLPYVPNDRWLALDIDDSQRLSTDRLLYTAHFALPFDKTARQCGFLVDEWTEVVPTDKVDTGMVFHFDRPNCEAPQAWLLLTPARFTGAWQWTDVVDSLRETLDLAKQRAIEPKHVDALPYAPLLPATVMAHQIRELTLSVNLALNNRMNLILNDG